MTFLDFPLLVFCSSPEFSSVAAAFRHPPSGDFLSCAFFPFDVFPLLGSHSLPDLPSSGISCLLDVSHVLKAFLHPITPGLISCQSRPWGFSLEDSFPPTEPPALSSTYSLLRLANHQPLPQLSACRSPRMSSASTEFLLFGSTCLAHPTSELFSLSASFIICRLFSPCR